MAQLVDIVQSAIAIADIESAAIFVARTGSPELDLAAAARPMIAPSTQRGALQSK
jgi:hypothetical protein